MDDKNIHLHILNSGKILDNFIEDIENVTKSSIETISTYLPIQDIDIVIYDSPYRVIPEIGIGGSSLFDAHTIFIPLDSKFKTFKDVINIHLPRTLNHELNHIVRWQAIGHPKTLLDSLISEGLADHFDEEVSKGDTYPWDTALTKEDINKFLKKVNPLFLSEDYNHNAWFFGSKEIPRWTGYTLGYYLISQYLKEHLDKKPSMIFAVNSSEFIN